MRVHDLVLSRDLSPEELRDISREAGKFSSEIVIRFEESASAIDVKSLLGMMLLAVHEGTQFTLQTKGRDEEEAIHAICALFER